MKPTDHSRRRLAGSLVLASLAGLARRVAHAAGSEAGAEPAHLAEDDPSAKGLAYVEDASRADKIPGFVPGSRCENCLQLQGHAGDAFRPCPLFPGKLVSAGGWCKSWTPEI